MTICIRGVKRCPTTKFANSGIAETFAEILSRLWTTNWKAYARLKEYSLFVVRRLEAPFAEIDDSAQTIR